MTSPIDLVLEKVYLNAVCGRTVRRIDFNCNTFKATEKI